MSAVFTIILLFSCSSFCISQPAIQITALVPSCGPLNGVTSVAIRGKGFQLTDQIQFGSSVLSGSHVIFKSAEELLFFVSGRLATKSQNYTINVVSSNGKMKSNRRYFNVYEVPNFIEKINPKIGWEGDTLTVEGDFMDCGAVKCRFGAVQMTVDAIFVSKAFVKCKVPRFDNHGVASADRVSQEGSTNATYNGSQIDNAGFIKNAPPPDPDKAKKITISSDGQHFDSIPDNIVFTYRDPVAYVVLWIWLVCMLVPSAIGTLACVLGCCCCAKDKCCKSCIKFKSRKGYSKV